MRYNLLGSTGLLVSELCLGTQTFGVTRQAGMRGQAREEAGRMMRIALDAGVNFIDCADLYAGGQAEVVLGQTLKDLEVPRDQVVIATKGFARVGPGPNQRGASRYHLLHAIDDSLTRLQLDHVDLYQLHGFDWLTPVEEMMRALDDIVRSGKARYVGVSNWAAWQIEKALGISAREHLAPIVSQQAHYSLANRDVERELAPMLTYENVALTIWSPLARGFLSGAITRESSGPRPNVMNMPPVDEGRIFDIVDCLREIATKRGATVAQVALSWLLHQPVVTSIIIGFDYEDQLRDNLGCCDVDLDDDDLRKLDELSALKPEYPVWIDELQRNYFAAGLPSPRRR